MILFEHSKRSLAKPAVSLLCFVLVALPVAPQFHIAFAWHDHVYCGEHQRYEDIQAQLAQRHSPSTIALSANTSSDSHPLLDTHVACPVSNFSFQVTSLPSPPVVEQQSVDRSEQLQRQMSRCRLLAVFVIAPKQSPPEFS